MNSCYHVLDVFVVDLHLDEHGGALGVEPQVQKHVAKMRWVNLGRVALVLVPDQLEVHLTGAVDGEMEAAILRHEKEECQHPQSVAAERQASQHVRNTSCGGHIIVESVSVVVHCLVGRGGEVMWS